jgi:aryl-alcohol dehydrogenase-like predicted oxidoreductase
MAAAPAARPSSNRASSRCAGLKTDYIDLYWMHFWDPNTPIDETMRALDDLVRAGKVRYIGVSDTPAWKVAQANLLSQFHGWSPFIGLQVEYSLSNGRLRANSCRWRSSSVLASHRGRRCVAACCSGKYTALTLPKSNQAGASASRRS